MTEVVEFVSEEEIRKTRLSEEEIRKIPRFSCYSPGEPSQVAPSGLRRRRPAVCGVPNGWGLFSLHFFVNKNSSSSSIVWGSCHFLMLGYGAVRF